MKNQPLLPELIGRDNDAYPIVEDLKEVLDVAFGNKKIKNIALTGPYGSGKSSILDTLLTILPKERKTLRISLATLRVDDTIANYESVPPNQRDREDAEEALNRKIEYSILQQLIYHEKARTVPSSRLRRILHIPPRELSLYSFGVIVFVLSFFIAFEPSWARIETFYTLFNWGWVNIAFDIVSALYMFWGMWFVLRKVISSYSNSKLNKLNLKEASIELNEDTSIFNRHLDEILYFFQATEYDVVIIEDLDRFGTSKVFLKLRELNFLLNESKVIERHIVFLYAVKDDIFKDEERTKFFDYISTVIPVINPSNSRELLKKALECRNVLHNDITDDDLSEMAFFIQDMRILKNIANEYAQYHNLLCKDNKHLDRTKLLAMIVYKNYHPQDFAMLHRRQGKVYECLSKKTHFINLALKKVEKKKAELAEIKQRKEDSLHLQEDDLRTLLLDKLRDKLPEKFYKVRVENEYHTLSEVATNPNLFEELINATDVQYQYWGNYNNLYSDSISIDFVALKDEMDYDSRLQAMRATPQSMIEMEQSILCQELEISGCSFKDLYSYFDMHECEEYTKIGLSPLMDVFLRLGYLNEEYYDYISYFYEGMITQNDHDLLLSIKRRIAQSPSTPIDKIENFHKELKPYMFEHKSILNNDLVDYVAQNSIESFERIMKTIEKKDVPLGFLAQYYLLGSEQEKVFEHFITWGKKRSWSIIEKHSNDKEKVLLQEAWLRFSDGIVDVPQEWLNANFQFIESHYDNLGIERCLTLCTQGVFEEINSTNEDLIDCIIEHCSYTINIHNIGVIVSHLTKQSIDAEALNYSRCLSTNNRTFIDYVNGNLENSLMLFLNNSKEEDFNGILALLNTNEITKELKETYLRGQKKRLTDYTDISEDALELATQLLLIEPTWENVIWYFQQKNELTEELITYIEHFKIELSEEIMVRTEEAQPFFESIVVCPQIPDSTLSQLLKVFTDNVLDGVDVTNLSENRLTLLLDKFPFTDDNTEILNNTPIFANYLIANSDDMLSHISSELFCTPSISEKVLTANKFSRSEKEVILRAIPESHLYSSTTIANAAIEILDNNSSMKLEEDTFVEIIKKSTLQDKRLKLVTRKIENTSDHSEIAKLLNLLGGVYIEIAEREKRPKMDKNKEVETLLCVLRSKGFISSYIEDKDGISWRVYPPRD